MTKLAFFLFSPVILWAATQSHPETVTVRYTKLVDNYFEREFKDHPKFATSSGIHRYDDGMQDFSKKGITDRVSTLKTFLKKFESISKKTLKRSDALDLELVKNHILAELLDLEQVRSWEKNPDIYSSGISEAIYVLMSRQFDTPAARLKSVISREIKSLELLKQARENLSNPPRVYTEIALEQLPGIIRFFEKDVPLAFQSVKEKEILTKFQKSNLALIQGLKDYEIFLRETILPKSKGDYRLGAELYKKKLLYEEFVDRPLEELLKIGWEDLKRNQSAYKETAAKIDPKKTPEQILEEVGKDHPKPEDLLPEIRKQVVELKKFLEEKDIVSIPSDVLPTIQETPPFMRALTFASMDTPGPFETKATEAYYNVTLPEPGLPEKELEEYMAGFNYAVSMSTSIHEAYPGHYTQFLWVPKAPSKVRKLMGANTNVEGWAHYCEQMVLDEGFAKGNLKMRLGQLQDALLRNARFIVGIRLHTGEMTFSEGVDFFVKEGYQTRAVAEKETKRGTADPIYLYYTLGKIEILKLRQDYQAKKGEKFNLREFHNEFLKRGFPPIQIVREELLGEGVSNL
jgi:uncharacterized protein (DUF885 family)